MDAVVDKGPVFYDGDRLFLRRDIVTKIIQQNGLSQNYEDADGNVKVIGVEPYVYVDGIVELYGIGDLENQSGTKVYASGLFLYSNITSWFGKSAFGKNWVQLVVKPHLSGRLSLPPSLKGSYFPAAYMPATPIPYAEDCAYFDTSELLNYATEWLGFPTSVLVERIEAEVGPHLAGETRAAAPQSDDTLHPKERKTLEALVAAMDALLVDAGVLDPKPFTSGQQLEAQMSAIGIPNHPKAKTLGEKIKAIRSKAENSK